MKHTGEYSIENLNCLSTWSISSPKPKRPFIYYASPPWYTKHPAKISFRDTWFKNHTKQIIQWRNRPPRIGNIWIRQQGHSALPLRLTFDRNNILSPAGQETENVSRNAVSSKSELPLHFHWYHYLLLGFGVIWTPDHWLNCFMNALCRDRAPNAGCSQKTSHGIFYCYRQLFSEMRCFRHSRRLNLESFPFFSMVYRCNLTHSLDSPASTRISSLLMLRFRILGIGDFTHAERFCPESSKPCNAYS